ncbi:MAG: hypothetical protein E6K69_02185 [Nitrospirae bacterium]|nr:MAG: hypothetical protein E6K69_02185 [Nitrospirota bacterium]
MKTKMKVGQKIILCVFSVLAWGLVGFLPGAQAADPPVPSPTVEEPKGSPPSGDLQERGVPIMPQLGVRPVTTIRVTATDIAKLPAKTPYILDLTRQGVIYECDSTAARIDFSRVAVRTAKATTPIATLMNGPLKSRVTSQWSSSRFRMGSSSSFGRIKVGPRGTNFSCEGAQCTCTGDADCNDMFSSGVCGDIAVCNETGCTCLTL